MSCHVTAAEAFERTTQLIIQHSDYEAANSLTSARALLSAITTRILLLPDRQQEGGAAGESISWSLKDLIAMRDRVSKWIVAKEQQQRSRISKVRFCRYRT